MNAILTGSRRYGTPHADSDIDLVVLVDEKTLTELIEQSDPIIGMEKKMTDYATAGACGLRFGKLNLLVCTKERQFAQWALGSAVLAEQKPVTRETAVNVMDKLRQLTVD